MFRLTFTLIIAFFAFNFIVSCQKSVEPVQQLKNAVDSISSNDAAALALFKDTSLRLRDIRLEDGEAVDTFMFRADPGFLQSYPSRNLTGITPSDQLRLFIARMIVMGNYIVTPINHIHPAGNDPNIEPAQSHLAYLPGGKDYDQRYQPSAGECFNNLFVYGLDCSGMIYQMTTKSSIPEIVPKRNFNVSGISKKELWNTAFKNSSDYQNLKMVDLGPLSAANIKPGDVIIWPNAPHIGFAITDWVYMSSGSFFNPSCQDNLNKGPVLKKLSDGLLNAIGSGVYKIFRPQTPIYITNPSRYPITLPLTPPSTECVGTVICDFECEDINWDASTNVPKFVDENGVTRLVNGVLVENARSNWGAPTDFITSGIGLNWPQAAVKFYNVSINNHLVKGKVSIVGDFGNCNPANYPSIFLTKFNFSLIYSTLGNTNINTNLNNTYKVFSNVLFTSQ